MSEIFDRLYAGLRTRRTPQAVALDLLALGAADWLSDDGVRHLHGMVIAGRGPAGTSMPATWRHHPGLPRAYGAAAAAVSATGAPPMPAADPTDVASLDAWLDAALAHLGLPAGSPPPARPARSAKTTTVTWGEYTFTRPRKPPGARGDTRGHADARTRMDAATRRRELGGVSVRAYRRAVRAVLHLQQRVEVLAAERDREAAIAFGKTRLAHLAGPDDFAACPRTAAFTAYYVARLGMRTVFTAGPQARPMDELAEELLAAALAAPTVRADVLALVTTRQKVLDRLTDDECGRLLGRYYEQLAACARALRGAFDPHRDPRNMVVRRGDDSSTWNAASRAFNQARTGWLNLTWALGYDDLVEACCPGKVPALVASDVAFWHASEGGREHVDTRIWAELPWPWDAVLGDDECPADLVRAACWTYGVDPDASGWTAPYRQDHLERPAPAPDLVHGIAVASPLLATMLRHIGVFSGQLGNRVAGGAGVGHGMSARG